MLQAQQRLLQPHVQLDLWLQGRLQVHHGLYQGPQDSHLQAYVKPHSEPDQGPDESTMRVLPHAAHSRARPRALLPAHPCSTALVWHVSVTRGSTLHACRCYPHACGARLALLKQLHHTIQALASMAGVLTGVLAR